MTIDNQDSANSLQRVAVIGGGVTGLTAAYDLTRPAAQRRFAVSIFEGAPHLGGLAAGFKGRPTWEWPLEHFYHHLFLSDRAMLGLLDAIAADAWLRQWMGGKAYAAAWEFQLQGKFGDYYKEVNLAWFWARVFARTPKLAYFDGGFQAFVDHLAQRVREQGTAITTGAAVEVIRPRAGGGFEVTVNGQVQHFDQVLSTVGPGAMQRLAPDLPADYLGQLGRLKSMGAVVLTVALDRKLTDDMYWISLPKREGIPFLALVEHTNMIDPRHYAGDHLLYLGDYLPPEHRYFDLSAEALLNEFAPHLVKFNPAFDRAWITGAWVHKAKYAQPVPPVGYLELIPALRTPLSGLYFASMSQVYPWDRGTNFAVELGRKVAGMIGETR